MAQKKAVVITTDEHRCSFANVNEPRLDDDGNPQWSVCIMVSKKNKKAIAHYEKCVQEAIAIGVAIGKYPKTAVKSLKLPMHDGTEEYKNEERGKEFNDHIYFNANTRKAPGIANSNGRPSVGDVEIYSGCWIRAHISFYPFNNKGRKGIAVGLNHVMFVKDDDRFDGRVGLDDAFAEFQTDDGGTEQAEGGLI